ncbi:pyridoxal phosphate-dependent aminotransferase [Treponema sp. OMZ 840]|uniref:pyridoxal phosphate-dependent aminotransferase n=1 Tax=Treponema sp. OMZ 840 TaxID=244313 RepID=UPI003D902E0A
MAVAEAVKSKINGRENAGIRSMFETGLLLKKQFGAENVFDFSLGNPSLEPPEQVRIHMQKLAADTSCGLHSYMPNAGLPECRQAVARKVSKEQGTCVCADRIVMSSGAAGALNVFLKAVLNPGDAVFVSVPFFPEYAHYAANHGGLLHPIACKDDMSLDTDAFEKAFAQALKEKKDVAAVIVNSPNNPSGKIYTEKNISGLVSLIKSYAEKTGKKPYLICDEPYRDIVYDTAAVPAVFPLYTETVIVSSFAKNLSLPGERIGYLALNPSAENVHELFQACSFTNRILGFVNAPAFFQRVIEKTWDVPVDYSAYKKRRALIIDAADTAGLQYIKPEGAFYLFCKVPESRRLKTADDYAFCEHLQRYRILCVPGSVFGCPGWIRAAYCTDEKTIIHCKAALKEACEAW